MKTKFVAGLVLCLGAYGTEIRDAELSEVSVAEQGLGFAVLKGRLTFDADYENSAGNEPGVGSIPTTANAYVRNLFVCAFDQQGGHDFETSETNDILLGCDRADNYGRYAINITISGSDHLDPYLVTTYCDDDETSAEVCVVKDVHVASYFTTKEYLKKTWSETSWNLINAYSWGSAYYLNWNLSCPHHTASTTSGYQSLKCSDFGMQSAGDETGSWMGWLYDDNSDYGLNKEFVHLFRAAIEPVRRHGTMKPNAANAEEVCSHAYCDDPIYITVMGARHRISARSVLARTCDPLFGSYNYSAGYRTVCMRQWPTDYEGGTVANAPYRGAVNPFSTVHEIGHNVHRRWLRFQGNASGTSGCSGGVGWASGGNELGQTFEGWANFVSAASWFTATATNPVHNERDMENSADSDLAGSCCAPGDSTCTNCGCGEGALLGEGRPSQFFWDLFDAGGVQLSFSDIRRVWSQFPDGTGDAMNDENNPDGRNVEDFENRYNQLAPSFGWPSIAQVQIDNCVDRHRAWTFNDGCN